MTGETISTWVVLVLTALNCEVHLANGDGTHTVTNKVGVEGNELGSGLGKSYENRAHGASNREILLDLMENDKGKSVNGVIRGEDELSSIEENSNVDKAEGDEASGSGESFEGGSRINNGNHGGNVQKGANDDDGNSLGLQNSLGSGSSSLMTDRPTVISPQEKEHDNAVEKMGETYQNEQTPRFEMKSDTNEKDDGNEMITPESVPTRQTKQNKEELGSSSSLIKATLETVLKGKTTGSQDVKTSRNRSKDEGKELAGEPEFSGRYPKHFYSKHIRGERLHEGNEESGSGESFVQPSSQDAKQDRTEYANEANGSGSTEIPIDFRDSGDEPTAPKTLRRKPLQNYTRKLINAAGESEEGRAVPVDPILLLQMRKIRANVLKAQEQATKELNDARAEFRVKMNDIQQDLKLVKSLTSKVHKKIGITVREAIEMAREAKIKATRKLNQTRRAATALDNIEKELGVDHTLNTSRILRSKIPLFPKLNKVNLYQQLLQTNTILTKLEGAKVLAVNRAERRFKTEETAGSSIEEEVESLKHELASAEDELSAETEVELEDEREAQEKLEEAVQRNRIIAKKTAIALKAIESYLEKLESDESRLEGLKF